MHVQTKILLYFLFLPAISIIQAQETWNLNRCISYSLENNLALKNASLSCDAQRLNLSQARFNQLPQVSAQVSMNESFGRTVDPGTNTYSDVSNFNNSYGIGTSVSLFSGFVQRNRIAFEKFNWQAEKNRFEQQKNIVIYSVISAYYNFLLEDGIFRLATENLQLMEDQHFSTRRLIDVGRKAESDIYDFDAKLATDSFLLIQQEGQMQKAMLLLKKSMNYPFSDSLNIDTIQTIFYTISDSIEIKKLLESAMHQLPDIKISENELMAAKKYLALVRGNFSPSVGLGAGWNTGYYKKSDSDAPAFNEQFKNNAGEYVGVSVNFPIFSKFSKINNLKQARINYEKAEIAHQNNIIILENTINTAYIDWQTTKKEYLAAQRQLDKSRIAYLSAEKKLNLGQINVIDFYIQKNEFLKARTELLRTRLQLALQGKFVEFLLTGSFTP